MKFRYLIFIYSILLIFFGLVYLFFIETESVVFTPIVFGGIILIMGIMSVNKDLILFGQHGATALSLIAFITSVSGFIKMFKQTETFYSYFADVYIASLSLIFLVLAVRQFGIDRKELKK